MTEAQKKKNRAIAAKLSKPTPVELSNGKWRCQVMVRGQRISVIESDPKAAHAKAVALREGILEATCIETATLGAAALQYIQDRESVLSPPTIKGYNIIVKKHCLELQKKRIKDIREPDLQAEIGKLSETLSVKSVKNIIGFYISVITMYKPINQKRLNYGQQQKAEHAYLEEEEIVKIISAAVGDWMEVPILLALWLGMRRSEICGLAWESVDFEKKKIRVTQTKLVNSEGEYEIVNRTKTRGSRRTIDCPDYILLKLAEVQPDESKRTGPIFDMYPNAIYRGLKRVSKKAGVKFVGVHGLRHTNATVMASLGLVDKAIMARGGWSSDRVLKDVYEHLFSKDKADADQALNEYFEAAIGNDLHTICTQK